MNIRIRFLNFVKIKDSMVSASICGFRNIVWLKLSKTFDSEYLQAGMFVGFYTNLSDDMGLKIKPKLCWFSYLMLLSVTQFTSFIVIHVNIVHGDHELNFSSKKDK